MSLNFGHSSQGPVCDPSVTIKDLLVEIRRLRLVMKEVDKSDIRQLWFLLAKNDLHTLCVKRKLISFDDSGLNYVDLWALIEGDDRRKLTFINGRKIISSVTFCVAGMGGPDTVMCRVSKHVNEHVSENVSKHVNECMDDVMGVSTDKALNISDVATDMLSLFDDSDKEIIDGGLISIATKDNPEWYARMLGEQVVL